MVAKKFVLLPTPPTLGRREVNAKGITPDDDMAATLHFVHYFMSDS